MIVYWTLFGIGALAMTAYIVLRCRQAGIGYIRTIMFTFVCLIGGFLAGKLMAALSNWDSVMEAGFFSVGQSIMGPVFCDILLVPVAGHLFGLKKEFVHDLCGPSLAILIAFQRIGCFFEGCCGGILATIGSMSFRWPAQIMESIGDFLIFGILLDYEKTGRYKGRLYPMFLFYYGCLRFLVEFVRIPEKRILFLSHWQWWAIAAVCVGYFWNNSVKEKNYENN